MHPRGGRVAVRTIVQAGAFALALIGIADPARGQAALDQPAVVPPVLEQRLEVAYPAGAEGNESVVLTITVARDGTVQSVEVDTGNEPFASAAKAAALDFRFEPAK